MFRAYMSMFSAKPISDTKNKATAQLDWETIEKETPAIPDNDWETIEKETPPHTASNDDNCWDLMEHDEPIEPVQSTTTHNEIILYATVVPEPIVVSAEHVKLID